MKSPEPEEDIMRGHYLMSSQFGDMFPAHREVQIIDGGHKNLISTISPPRAIGLSFPVTPGQEEKLSC